MNKKSVVFLTFILCFVFSSSMCFASHNNYSISVESVSIDNHKNLADITNSSSFKIKNNQSNMTLLGIKKNGLFVGSKFKVENIKPTTNYGTDYNIKLNIKYCDIDNNIDVERFYEINDNLDKVHYIYLPIGNNQYILYRFIVNYKK